MTKLLLRRLLSDAKREGLAQVGYLPMILLNLCRLSRSSNQTRPRSRSLRSLSRRRSIATMISAKDRTSRPTIEWTFDIGTLRSASPTRPVYSFD